MMRDSFSHGWTICSDLHAERSHANARRSSHRVRHDARIAPVGGSKVRRGQLPLPAAGNKSRSADFPGRSRWHARAQLYSAPPSQEILKQVDATPSIAVADVVATRVDLAQF